MTLVEVIASLALLGSLLGASVVAQSRLTRQWNAAHARGEAVEALDAQLERWRSLDVPNTPDILESDIVSSATIAWPISGEGPLGVEPWWWRAEQLPEQPGEDFGISLIRYTAYDPNDLEQRAVATLDVILYQPTPTTNDPGLSVNSGEQPTEVSISYSGLSSADGGMW